MQPRPIKPSIEAPQPQIQLFDGLIQPPQKKLEEQKVSESNKKLFDLMVANNMPQDHHSDQDSDGQIPQGFIIPSHVADVPKPQIDLGFSQEQKWIKQFKKEFIKGEVPHIE